MADPKLTPTPEETARAKAIAASEAIFKRWEAEAKAEKKKIAEAKAAAERAKNPGALRQGADAIGGKSASARMLEKIEH